MGKYYEIVIFTASMSKYADPLIKLIDKSNVVKAMFFRESCTYLDGSFVKDLSKLGRHMRNVILLDNSPICFSMQPENGIPIKSWYNNKSDVELMEYTKSLILLSNVPDVRTIIPFVTCSGSLNYDLLVNICNSLHINLNNQNKDEDKSNLNDQYNEYFNEKDDVKQENSNSINESKNNKIIEILKDKTNTVNINIIQGNQNNIFINNQQKQDNRLFYNNSDINSSKSNFINFSTKSNAIKRKETSNMTNSSINSKKQYSKFIERSNLNNLISKNSSVNLNKEKDLKSEKTKLLYNVNSDTNKSEKNNEIKNKHDNKINEKILKESKNEKNNSSNSYNNSFSTYSLIKSKINTPILISSIVKNDSIKYETYFNNKSREMKINDKQNKFSCIQHTNTLISINCLNNNKNKSKLNSFSKNNLVSNNDLQTFKRKENQTFNQKITKNQNLVSFESKNINKTTKNSSKNLSKKLLFRNN